MCVTNLHKTQSDHAERMARFSLAATQAAEETLIDLDDPSKGYVQIRVGFHSGFAHQLIDNKRHNLKNRVGLGGSRDFGGPSDDWDPELQFGSEYEWNINDLQKLTMTANYYPNIEDRRDYRVNVRASWDIKLSQERDLRLKITAYNRYDSRPGSFTDPNDLDYTLSLALGF